MERILVVCVGNICRSPLGERLLQAGLQDRFTVTSAGIAALEGHAADETSTDVAIAHGTSLEGHVARQFSRQLGLENDLILVMEPGHKREIGRMTPELLGKVMLFDKWTSNKGISDPYRHSREMHEIVYDQVAAAAAAWAKKLGPKS
jgi:protein-tyrosine phosphatase